MYQSRDEIRRTYLEVWRRLKQGQVLEPMQALIAEVIEMHPEYHDLLDRGDEARQRDFPLEAGQTNPFLHMGMHIALREQAMGDRPAGVGAIYRRLSAARGRHEAEHAMMECLGESLWKAQREACAPDEAEYLACLEKL